MNEQLKIHKQQLKHFEETLEKLKAEFHREKEPLNQQIQSLRREIVFEEFGIKLGSTVLYNGIKHKVVEIQFTGFGRKPWAIGNPIKKNGEFGNSKRMLYNDWEIAT